MPAELTGGGPLVDAADAVDVPPGPKAVVAHRILDRIVALRASK